MTTVSRRDLIRKFIAAGGALAVAPQTLLHASAIVDEAFVELPYIQLGNVGAVTDCESVTVVWHAADDAAVWGLEYRPVGNSRWELGSEPESRLIAIEGIDPHRVFSAVAYGLSPGARYEYQVRKAGSVVFAAQFSARKSAEMPYRFCVFGDCGGGSVNQRHVGFQAYEAKPDFVLIPGDIVYESGRISEYRRNFFTVYNRDQVQSEVGVPLMRDTLFVGTVGNHDIAHTNLDIAPDALAFYHYWNQPLNGPSEDLGTTNMPPLKGTDAHISAFKKAAGINFPQAGTFSFDYGNAHWMILDGDKYMDWDDPKLREWIKLDLASSQDSTWRFVSHHFPPFNSAKTHYGDQQMRVINDLLEEGNVDVVFTGHVHNYQRTYPLRFAVKRDRDGKPVYQHDDAMGAMEILGDFTFDKEFDGKTKTKPNGIITLVSGAGGKSLYNPETQFTPELWKPYTYLYNADCYSMTQVDVKGSTAEFKQISDHGKIIDSFIITK